MDDVPGRCPWISCAHPSGEGEDDGRSERGGGRRRPLTRPVQLTTTRADATFGINRNSASTLPSRCDRTRAVAKKVPGVSYVWVVERFTEVSDPSTSWLNGNDPHPSKSQSTETIVPALGGTSASTLNSTCSPALISALSSPLAVARTTGCTPARSAADAGSLTCPSTYS